MLEAALWGVIASSSLTIGSLLTFWLKPGRRIIGLIMAFGAGAQTVLYGFVLLLAGIPVDVWLKRTASTIGSVA